MIAVNMTVIMGSCERASVTLNKRILAVEHTYARGLDQCCTALKYDETQPQVDVRHPVSFLSAKGHMPCERQQY